MSEAAAAAPAVDSSASSDTGEGGGAEIQTSATPKPKPVPKPPTNGVQPKPRMNDGRFAPKEGNQLEPAKGEEAKGKEQEKKEEYRFRRKLKLFGQEEDVDLGEEDIARNLQRLRMFERKEADIRKTQAQAKADYERLMQLAKERPDEFLREAGHDPDAVARRRLAEQARLQAMDEHERAVYERDQEIQRLKQEAQARAEADKAARQKLLNTHLKQKNEKLFISALEKGGLPKTHESLFYLAETYDMGLEDGIEYTDAELAAETGRRLDALADRYLGSLDGKALAKRLGPKRVQAILEAQLAEYEATHPLASPDTHEPEPEPAPKEDDGYISEAEMKRRLRTFGR